MVDGPLKFVSVDFNLVCILGSQQNKSLVLGNMQLLQNVGDLVMFCVMWIIISSKFNDAYNKVNTYMHDRNQ